MSVLEKARELGAELSKSKELINVREAEEMMLKNPEAQKAIQEFNAKQKAFQVLVSQGLQLTDGQKKEIEELELKMLDNPYVYNYFKAQQEFEKTLDAVNNIIGEAIGVNPSCSCGCGSNSGSAGSETFN